MEYVYDSRNMKWLPAQGSILSRNALFTLWRCTIADNDRQVTIPVIEYFNGVVFIPYDLNRDYPQEIYFSDAQHPALNRDMKWIEMNSGRSAVLMNGLPM